MPSTATYNCARCGTPFTGIVSDRKRGRARFCSKSCSGSAVQSRQGRTGRATSLEDLI